MIRLTGRPHRACDGFTRRTMLHVGSLAALGLAAPDLLGETSSRTTPGFGRARACLLVYLFGGPSQIDTFDPKPDAPAGVRGEFRPIATTVPGVSVCEHLPRLAGLAEKYCLVRGMCHEHPRHGWGLYY